MNPVKRITVTLAFAALFNLSARGQGFLNLDFESAQNLPGNPPADGVLVATSNALPGWTAYDGPNALADVYYLSNTLAGTAASVGLDGGSLALSGNFSVELYGGSISQTGLVPGNAESLLFEAQGPGAGGSLGASGLEAALGGQSLSFSILSESPNYWVYGANIPADMDGQMETLAFSSGGDVVLDNIEFSSMSVPEPSTCALIGLGALLLGVRHLRRRAIHSQS
ncbi:MAG TPA: PEP-CTERM sorting domain-containing protein [Candidatus Acidoferrales bacterium]|jgi:hypothetical protein|nr:PEP-CTERM sorting domain-containing protein [Candidatus Acidoferrales bacterium]